MNIIQIILVIIAGVFCLWVGIKFWKISLALIVLGILCVAVLCIIGSDVCPFTENPGNGDHYDPQPQPQPQALPTPNRFPDLVIERVQQQPKGAMLPKGTPISYLVTVANRGNASWDGYIVVQGPGNHQGGFRGLRPGETKVASVPLSVGASGPGQITVPNIYFRVDPDNVIKEFNENNNQRGPFSVTLF